MFGWPPLLASLTLANLENTVLGLTNNFSGNSIVVITANIWHFIGTEISIEDRNGLDNLVWRNSTNPNQVLGQVGL